MKLLLKALAIATIIAAMISLFFLGVDRIFSDYGIGGLTKLFAFTVFAYITIAVYKEIESDEARRRRDETNN